MLKKTELRLFSWNVNGLRSCREKGFLEWFKKADPDVLCLQEIKAYREQLDFELTHVKGYNIEFFPSKKPGYSGVAIYSKQPWLTVSYGVGDENTDDEGRVLVVEYDFFYLINAYFPNSQRDHARLLVKIEFCKKILSKIKELEKHKPVVLCGDLNIAHQPIDLKNPKQNENNAGYLPEERAMFSEYLNSGLIDIFRDRVSEPGHYTWWSYRPGVRQRNIGWRLDYHLISESLKYAVVDVRHHPDVMGSDHCPIELVLKF